MALDPHMVNHARDIPDVDFLRAIVAGGEARQKAYGFDWRPGATRWDVGKALLGKPLDDFTDTEGLNQKLVLAKARNLIRRGRITGCACGCRGDFELTSIGEVLISVESDSGSAAAEN